jgi:hypothetical protein
MGRIPAEEQRPYIGEYRDRKYTISHMWEKHHEVKRLALIGTSPKVIAETLGCTPENINAIVNSPLFKKELEVMRMARDSDSVEVAKHIQRIGSKGLNLLEAIVDGVDEGEAAPLALRARVVQDCLDRTVETAKVNRVKSDSTVRLIDDNDIERIMSRARAIKERNRVDASFEVVTEGDTE